MLDIRLYVHIRAPSHGISFTNNAWSNKPAMSSFIQHLLPLANELAPALRKARLQVADDNAKTPPFSCPTFDSVSKASLPTCPIDCGHCCEQYTPQLCQEDPGAWSRVQALTNLEAEAHVQSLVIDTDNNYAYIRDAIDKNGDTILKRWRRRAATKRANIVLQAMPGISPTRFAAAHLMDDFIRKLKQADIQEHDDM